MKTELVKYAQKTAITANLIGLAIPFLWITIYVLDQAGFPEGLYWYEDVEYPIAITIGGISMLVSSYFIAGYVAQSKITSKAAFIFASSGTALAAVIIASILGSVAFFIEGYASINDQITADILVKHIGIPTLASTVFCGIPATIIGGVSGFLLYRKKQSFAKQM